MQLLHEEDRCPSRLLKRLKAVDISRGQSVNNKWNRTISFACIVYLLRVSGLCVFSVSARQNSAYYVLTNRLFLASTTAVFKQRYHGAADGLWGA